MKKLLKYKLLILFLLFIFIIPILTGFGHNKNISSIENRTLMEIPIYDKKRLLSGQYFREWEGYLSDHIVGRNQCIKFHTFLNMKILGKKNVNNIVIGKNHTLLPFCDEEFLRTLETNFNNLPTMIGNLDKINIQVKKYGGEFLFIGLPSQLSFYRDRYFSYLPFNKEYYVDNETKMFEGLEKKGIGYINMNKVFADDYDDEYYLKTDHHFSFKGSFKTYQETIKRLGITPLEPDDLDIITLEKPILGSRNRQIYFYHETDEKVTIAYPKKDIEYKKFTNGVESHNLYFVNEDPNVRPSYGVYMGGDHAEIVIHTYRDELPSILIFGDSFTNALEPLLYYHFNETRILDLRHYKGSINEYIEQYQPDIVLMIRDDLNYGNLEGNGRIE